MDDFVEGGYVHLARQSVSSQVFQNEGLWKLWTWCLMKANHDKNWDSITIGKGKTEVSINRGQFLFGRKKAAKELRMKPETVRDRMTKLKNIGNIAMQSTSHYTVVTICNYERYQDTNNYKHQPSRQPSANHPPSKHQPSATYNNDNNINNVNNVDKKKRMSPKKFADDSLEIELANYLLTHLKNRKPDIKLPNIQKWAAHMDKMIKLDNRQPETIRTVIDWCQADSFWQNNIMSTKKLREQFDALELKSNERTSISGSGKAGQGQVLQTQTTGNVRERIEDQDWEGELIPT